MSKGFVVMDIPENCKECSLAKNYVRAPHSFGKPDTYEVHCAALGNKQLKPVPQNCKPDWCPICSFPEKRYNTDPLYENDEWCDGWDSGWNACVDEITGGDITE